MLRYRRNRMMAKTFAVLLLGVLAAVPSPNAAAKTLEEELDTLDSFIQTLLVCRSDAVAGLTVSVVRDGNVVFARGYGRRDSNRDLPVNDRTLFGVASISKSFTAALLADILQERNVTWDTPLVDFLGEDFRFQDEFRTKEATLRDVLAHKMGLQKFPANVNQFGMDVDRAEMARMVRYCAEVRPFRTDFYYSNYLYALAGHVAERLAGKPYEQLLRERIFLPLGMSDTTFLSDALEEDNFSNFAQSYVMYNKDGHSLPVNREIYRIVKLLAPAGGVATNAVDMASYMQYLLRRQRASDDQPNNLLREAFTVQFLSDPAATAKFRQIFRPQFPVGVTERGEGLGVVVGQYRGFKRVSHGGRLFGFTSMMTLFPDQSAGVFTSLNGPVLGWDRDMNRILHYRIADMLLGLTPWLNTTTACTYPQPWGARPATEPNVPPATSRDFPRDKRDYVGSYGNHVFGNLTISLNSTDDTLRFKAGLVGRGVVLPLNASDSVLLKGPIDMLAPAQVFLEEEGGVLLRLVFPGEPPEPPVVFERGLKLRDEASGSQQEVGCAPEPVSGAETTVYRARLDLPLLAAFLLAFAFI